jgi:GNAT superfamily N-acetyltransferase
MTIMTTVTYMEMTSYPTHLNFDYPAKTKIDVKQLVDPSVEFYRYLYNTIGEKWTWIERRILSDVELQKLIKSPNIKIYVLYFENVVAGFGEIGWDEVTKGSDIKYFGLMPEFIGKGLGRYFLHTIIHKAWQNFPLRLRVNTCDLDHPTALGLYQQAGFKILDEIIETLPDPSSVGLSIPPQHLERVKRRENQ